MDFIDPSDFQNLISDLLNLGNNISHTGPPSGTRLIGIKCVFLLTQTVQSIKMKNLKNYYLTELAYRYQYQPISAKLIYQSR